MNRLKNNLTKYILLALLPFFLVGAVVANNATDEDVFAKTALIYKEEEKKLRAAGVYPEWAKWNLEKLENTSGRAMVLWDKNVCQVTIDPVNVKKMWGKNNSDLSLKFVFYHELSHCIYYKNHQLDWHGAGANPKVRSDVFDEIVAMDAFMEPEDRENWYAVSHEAHSDALAIGLLMHSGVSPKDLSFITALREANSFDSSHAVTAAGTWMLTSDWQKKGMSPQAAAARAAAIQMLVTKNFVHVLDFSEEEFKRIIMVNLTSSNHLAQRALQHNKEWSWVGRAPETKGALPGFIMIPWVFTKVKEHNSINYSIDKGEALAYLEQQLAKEKPPIK